VSTTYQGPNDLDPREPAESDAAVGWTEIVASGVGGQQ
jgi:hypothetical protein